MALDAWLGDPQRWLHPVQVMGWWVQLLQRWAEAWASERPARLRLAGGAITALTVLLSGASGWFLEWLALSEPVGWIPFVIALASALAWRSLDKAVRKVLAALPLSSDDGEPNELGAGGWSLQEARARLGWIVGRDVAQLDREGILRAVAETASENAVDGVFAPLFWMLAGAALWGVSGDCSGLVPGPLCLAWVMKAASTLDSMLGYHDGRLRWLGTAGARLDDCLVWPACRLVAITLPLSGGRWRHWKRLVGSAGRDGRLDPSPNAGLSQAIYARVIGVQLGGTNRYGGQIKVKPTLGAGGRRHLAPTDVQRILLLTKRLLLLWLLTAVGIGWTVTIMG